MSYMNLLHRFCNKLKSNFDLHAPFGKEEQLKRDLNNSAAGGVDLENYIFWSGEKYLVKQRTKLRRSLAKVYRKNNFIVREQISIVVNKFLENLRKETDRETNPLDVDEFLLMPRPFVCKCGWLLLNPTTLPCGHTMCKHCVDEKMFCTECGYTIEEPCSPNTFLLDVISRWFNEEYNATKLKLKSKILLQTNDLELALETISEALIMVSEDYTALTIRSEIYSKMGQHKDALWDSELACKLNPTDGKVQFRRGECYSNLGDLNNALDAFQLCLELEPDDNKLSNAVIQSIDKILSPPDLVDSNNVNVDDSIDSDDSDRECSVAKKSKTENTKEIDSPSFSDSNALTHTETANEPSTIKDISQCPSNEISDLKDENYTSQSQSSLSPKILSNDQPACSSTSLDILPDCDLQNDLQNDLDSFSDSQKPIDTGELLNGVPVHLIKEEDFECKLCYDLLYKPVTTTCGHVFCKNCLVRTLDHNPYCPICRDSLKDYLADPVKPVTTILVSILEIYFEEPLAERDKVYKERLEKLSRVGIDEDVEVPVMVCSIAYPYVSCPLHIFEPKYRLMVRECFESGSRKFGMCIPRSGRSAENEFSEIGTICEITRCQSLPDGRYIIHTVAGQRFTIVSKRVEDSIYYAKVRYFCDQSEDLGQEEFSIISKQTYDHLSKYINSLKTAEQDCIFSALGRLPPYEDNYSRYQHGVPWVWWGLSAIPLNLTAKLVMLRSKCISERMRSLQRFLRFLTKLNPDDNNHQQTSSSSSS